MGDFALRSFSRQSGIGTRPGQVTHAHRGDTKGAAVALPEKIGPQRQVFDIHQHPGLQFYRLKGESVFLLGNFLPGCTVNEIENQPRLMATRTSAGLLGILDR